MEGLRQNEKRLREIGRNSGREKLRQEDWRETVRLRKGCARDKETVDRRDPGRDHTDLHSSVHSLPSLCLGRAWHIQTPTVKGRAVPRGPESSRVVEKDGGGGGKGWTVKGPGEQSFVKGTCN